MSRQKTIIRSPYEIELDSSVRKLSGHYKLDKENKTFDIAMRYEKASDLFDENLVMTGKPRISDDVTDKMAQLVSDIPDGYKARFIFTIEDYEKYTSAQILEGINDALALRHLRYLRENKRADLRTGIMMVAGVTFIMLMTIGNLSGWWGEGNTVSEVLTYMMDTLGCVLIWEAIYAIFLERTDEMIFEEKISKKVQYIGLYREGDDHALSGESSQKIAETMRLNRRNLLTKKLLKLSGFSLIILAVWNLLDGSYTLTNLQGEMEAIYHLINNGFLSIVISVLGGCLGILALRAYSGKFRHPYIGLVLAVLMIISLVIDIVLLSTQQAPPQQIILVIFEIIVEASFVVGISMYISQFARANRAALKE
ncbi:MAG: hypothetical protein ACSW8H_01325 [bacterium]